jgi:hypothetical protein
LLALAAGLGCVFAIDTDAHAPGQLDWLQNGCDPPRPSASPPAASSTPSPLSE